VDGSVLGPEGWTGYARFMFSLGAILIVAYLTARFWRPKITRAGNSFSKRIRVLARFPLEPRKTLYVVGVGKQFILMASSDVGVQLMTRLDASDWNEQESSSGPASPPENGFAGLIASMRARRKD
jgi:flagellar biogenesis protein FliO